MFKIQHKKPIFETNLAQKVFKIEQKYKFLKLIWPKKFPKFSTKKAIFEANLAQKNVQNWTKVSVFETNLTQKVSKIQHTEKTIFETTYSDQEPS